MSMSSEREKRARLSHACDRCRKRHVKCDGDYPICGNCKSVNGECSYSHPGSKRGYVETIDDRLSKIEHVLSKFLEGTDAQHPAPQQTSNNTDKDACGSQEILTTHEIVTMAKSLEQAGQLNASKLPELMSAMTLSSNTRYVSMKNDSSHDALGAAKEKKPPTMELELPQEYTGSRDMPPKDLFDHLIEIYFTYGYSCKMPIIHRSTFLKQLKDKNNPPSILLLNSIFAVASIFSNDPRTRKDPDKPETAGDIFFERARSLLDDFMDKPRLSTVQALHFLAQFCVKSTAHSCRIWMLIGMSNRMAIDLGLNRDCYNWDIGKISKAEKAVRNRLFWANYVAEVVACASFGKSMPIYDYDVRLPYEIDDDGDESQDVINFIHLCKLMKILSNILQSKPYFIQPAFLRNTLPAIDAALSSWLLALPVHLQFNPPASGELDPSVSPYSSFLHQMYNTTLIHLHKPHIDSDEYPNIDSRKMCLHAATEITKIAQYMPTDTRRIYFSFSITAYCLAQAGMIHQMIITEPESTIQGQKNMRKTIEILRSLAESARLGSTHCCGITDCTRMLEAVFEAQLSKLKENKKAQSNRKNSSEGDDDFNSRDMSNRSSEGEGGYNNNGDRGGEKQGGGNSGNKGFDQAKTIPTPPPSTQQDMSEWPTVIKTEAAPENLSLLQQTLNNPDRPAISSTSPKSPQTVHKAQSVADRNQLQIPLQHQQRQYLSTVTPQTTAVFKSNPTPEPSPSFPQQQLQYHQQSIDQNQAHDVALVHFDIPPTAPVIFNFLAESPVVPSSHNSIHNGFPSNGITSVNYTGQDPTQSVNSIYYNWNVEAGEHQMARPTFNQTYSNSAFHSQHPSQSSHSPPSLTTAVTGATTVAMDAGITDGNQTRSRHNSNATATDPMFQRDQLACNFIFPISSDQNPPALLSSTNNQLHRGHGNDRSENSGRNAPLLSQPQILLGQAQIPGAMDIEPSNLQTTPQNEIWNQHWCA